MKFFKEKIEIKNYVVNGRKFYKALVRLFVKIQFVNILYTYFYLIYLLYNVIITVEMNVIFVIIV